MIVDPDTESISAVKIDGKIIMKGLERSLAVSHLIDCATNPKPVPDYKYLILSCGSGKIHSVH